MCRRPLARWSRNTTSRPRLRSRLPYSHVNLDTVFNPFPDKPNSTLRGTFIVQFETESGEVYSQEFQITEHMTQAEFANLIASNMRQEDWRVEVDPTNNLTVYGINGENGVDPVSAGGAFHFDAREEFQPETTGSPGVLTLVYHDGVLIHTGHTNN